MKTWFLMIEFRRFFTQPSHLQNHPGLRKPKNASTPRDSGWANPAAGAPATTGSPVGWRIPPQFPCNGPAVHYAGGAGCGDDRRAGMTHEGTSKVAVGWQRARSPVQQERRRRQILAAARELFRDLAYEEVSLNGIARAAGLSKSSVYLYYQTREEIFLDIYLDSFRRWVGDVVAAWAELAPGAGPRELVAAWVDAFWADGGMVSLQSLVATSLERNVSDHKLGDCLRMKLDQIGRLHQALARFFPALAAGDTATLTIHAFTLCGQFSAYHANPGLSRLLAQAEFAGLRRDYRAMATDALTIMLERMVAGEPVTETAQ
jgi:AcrR family transcriptional regulator